MKRIRSFVVTAIIGGLVVILPITILLVVIRWTYQMLSTIIAPLSGVLLELTGLQLFLADAIVILAFLAICFALGVFVKTRLGTLIYEWLENSVLSYTPGYKMIKETILLLVGRTRTPFSYVAFISPYDSSTWLTGFITDEHENGMYTVFVPTAPNPTSGNIFHLREKDVRKLEISIEEGVRTILSCGSGTSNFSAEGFSDNARSGRNTDESSV